MAAVSRCAPRAVSPSDSSSQSPPMARMPSAIARSLSLSLMRSRAAPETQVSPGVVAATAALATWLLRWRRRAPISSSSRSRPTGASRRSAATRSSSCSPASAGGCGSELVCGTSPPALSAAGAGTAAAGAAAAGLSSTGGRAVAGARSGGRRGGTSGWMGGWTGGWTSAESSSATSYLGACCASSAGFGLLHPPARPATLRRLAPSNHPATRHCRHARFDIPFLRRRSSIAGRSTAALCRAVPRPRADRRFRLLLETRPL